MGTSRSDKEQKGEGVIEMGNIQVVVGPQGSNRLTGELGIHVRNRRM